MTGPDSPWEKSARRVLAAHRADPLARYGHRVLELHQPEPRRLGEMPACSCGSTEVLCAYRCPARFLGLLDMEADR